MNPDDEQDKIRRLLKSQPTLTPPESFYQGVRRRIEAKNARPGFTWGIPLKAFATACVVMLVVVATREKAKEKKITQALDFVSVESYSPSDKNEMRSSRLKQLSAPRQEASGETKSKLREKESAAQRKVGDEKGISEKENRKVEKKNDEDNLRRMITEAPVSKSLAQRGDVRYQARDTEGIASQSSFEELQNAPAKPVAKNATSAIAGSAGAPTDELSSGGKGSSLVSGINLKEKWTECQTVVDCVAVPEPDACLCACDVFINIRYAEEYRKRRSEQCAQITSSPPCNKICADTIPLCSAGRCAAATPLPQTTPK